MQEEDAKVKIDYEMLMQTLAKQSVRTEIMEEHIGIKNKKIIALKKERDNMSELLETNYPASSLGPGMKYIKLGRSGLEVSQICCGTMGFGDLNRWGRKWLVGQAGADAVVKKAIDLGINWFDTANMYSLGASEELLGEALKHVGANRDELVIQTKVNQRMAQGPNMAGSSRKARKLHL